jgi:hypothetical protein
MFRFADAADCISIGLKIVQRADHLGTLSRRTGHHHLSDFDGEDNLVRSDIRQEHGIDRDETAVTQVTAGQEPDGTRRQSTPVEQTAISCPTETAGEHSTHIRVCIVLISALLGMFTLSLTLALWYSISYNDYSSGFTIGSYIVGAAMMVLGGAGWAHRPACKCWESKTERRVRLESAGIELRILNLADGA